jgi:TonB family protein
MRTILIMMFVLTGCASQVATEIDPSSLQHLKHDDWSMWLPMVKMAPNYPDSIVRRKVEGCVNIEFVINSQGKPQQFAVVKSIPEGVFDKYSWAALKRFRYDPSEANTDREPTVTNNILHLVWREKIWLVNGRTGRKCASRI